MIIFLPAQTVAHLVGVNASSNMALFALDILGFIKIDSLHS